MWYPLFTILNSYRIFSHTHTSYIRSIQQFCSLLVLFSTWSNSTCPSKTREQSLLLIYIQYILISGHVGIHLGWAPSSTKGSSPASDPGDRRHSGMSAACAHERHVSMTASKSNWTSGTWRFLVISVKKANQKLHHVQTVCCSQGATCTSQFRPAKPRGGTPKPWRSAAWWWPRSIGLEAIALWLEAIASRLEVKIWLDILAMVSPRVSPLGYSGHLCKMLMCVYFDVCTMYSAKSTE